jgi:hypothetical protein
VRNGTASADVVDRTFQAQRAHHDTTSIFAEAVDPPACAASSLSAARLPSPPRRPTVFHI